MKYHYKIQNNAGETPEARAMNEQLIIVKLDSRTWFKVANNPGVRISITGHVFYIENRGYLAFKHDGTPYNPIGGLKSLKSILETGGFIHFNDVEFMQPIEV